ncbi:MAG: ammonium transporter, partial [Chloroflexota bacterium]|nr:ammonium transporter [Chloroflexota bacterium]
MKAKGLLFALAISWCAVTVVPVLAQAPAAAPAPSPITTADLTSVKTPSADDKAKGDPDGGLTGTAADVTVADSKAGLSVADLANQAGQNK